MNYYMKTVDDIYNDIADKFYFFTKLNIRKGSLIDKFTLAISHTIYYIYTYIESIRNPHIYTKLTGNDIDSAGILVGCSREAEESDNNYLYRMISWNTNNQCANNTAIENALINLTYASNAKFIPYTFGTGTGTIYIIPIKLDSETKIAAINEVKEKVKDIVAATSYIEYIIPEILNIEINCYLSVYKGENNVKKNIELAFKEYINNIAPGEYLEIGELTKIGVNTDNVNYFNIADVLIAGKPMQSLEEVQVLQKKFVFDSINWNMVVR